MDAHAKITVLTNWKRGSLNERIKLVTSTMSQSAILSVKFMNFAWIPASPQTPTKRTHGMNTITLYLVTPALGARCKSDKIA